MSKQAIMELLGLTEDDFKPKDRIAAIEAKLDALTTYQGLTVRDMGGGVYEVVKQTEQPRGDYLNPIRWAQGMEVMLGLWYYDTDPELPAECVQAGIAETFGAPWLDVIAV